jgi:hypothetical protein
MSQGLFGNEVTDRQLCRVSRHDCETHVGGPSFGGPQAEARYRTNEAIYSYEALENFHCSTEMTDREYHDAPMCQACLTLLNSDIIVSSTDQHVASI